MRLQPVNHMVMTNTCDVTGICRSSVPNLVSISHVSVAIKAKAPVKPSQRSQVESSKVMDDLNRANALEWYPCAERRVVVMCGL